MALTVNALVWHSNGCEFESPLTLCFLLQTMGDEKPPPAEDTNGAGKEKGWRELLDVWVKEHVFQDSEIAQSI